VKEKGSAIEQIRCLDPPHHPTLYHGNKKKKGVPSRLDEKALGENQAVCVMGGKKKKNESAEAAAL